MADYLTDPRHREARNFIAVCLGLALGLALPIVAAHAAPASQGESAVHYISGGIGAGEAARMKKDAGDYALELEFLQRQKDGHDAYLAGDQVAIRNAAGKTVLQAVAQGPFLLADLPPGKYTVIASDAGRKQERVARVEPTGHEHLVFEWRE